MEEKFILECDTISEANEVALEASYNVMESYECIMTELEDLAENNDMDIDELCAENTAYEVYQLNSDAMRLPRIELDDLAYNDFESLVEKYGVK